MPTLRTITDTAAEKLKPAKTAQVDYFDRTYPGLVLRVSKTGVKSWNYVYRINGKPRRMTFGRFGDAPPLLTVEAAHEAWRNAYALVQKGQDPASKTPTEGRTDFAGVAAEWLKRDQAHKRTLDVTTKMLAREVLPKWGDREISEITRRNILDLIDGVADRGTVTMARRIFGSLHRLFVWAKARGIIETNPMDKLPKPGKAVKRERVLVKKGEKASDPYQELVAVWNGAERLGWPYGPAFQLLILTGARREEIAALRWDELDDPANPTTITLSGDRTKNGEEHTIPLSAPACAILAKAPRFAGGEFVFTSLGQRPISGWGRAKDDLDDLSGVEGWRTHDLRRTVATGLQRLGIGLQVTEAVLGHTAGSRAGVVGIYQTHDYAREKRAALEAWGRFVTMLIDEPVRAAIEAELHQGAHDEQDRARAAFTRAITEGNGAWNAYVASILTPADNLVRLEAKR
jgi:integrase